MSTCALKIEALSESYSGMNSLHNFRAPDLVTGEHPRKSRISHNTNKRNPEFLTVRYKNLREGVEEIFSYVFWCVIVSFFERWKPQLSILFLRKMIHDQRLPGDLWTTPYTDRFYDIKFDGSSNERAETSMLCLSFTVCRVILRKEESGKTSLNPAIRNCGRIRLTLKRKHLFLRLLQLP